jgi:hypothetical protein
MLGEHASNKGSRLTSNLRHRSREPAPIRTSPQAQALNIGMFLWIQVVFERRFDCEKGSATTVLAVYQVLASSAKLWLGRR